MTKAQRYLEIVRSRGENQKKLKKVYRNMRNKELFLMAYANLYANKGATTPGIDPKDTVDGMSLARIDDILKKLKEGNYKWKPVRRTYIEKKFSKKFRPLGLPGWNDKLVQEVIRMILEAYYEPQFRDCSHGFRPRRGCHTALREIYHTWSGVKWFIETDIKGCFDNIDHDVLIGILKRNIEDERFLKLMRDMLQAGYMENWKYTRTYSGTPQGGILSPLLANIVLNELDVYIEDVLIPKYTTGNARKRKRNTAYETARQKAIRAWKRGDRETYKQAKALQRTLPVYIPNDPHFKRLWYIRYADDSLLGLIGSKYDAQQIKTDVGNFIHGIKLEMSDEKTLITHAKTGEARFLNYHITAIWNDRSRTGKGRGKIRGKNGQIILKVPDDVVRNWIQSVKKDKTVKHRAELMNNSDYDIITYYETRIQGLINYYQMAHDVVPKMSRIRFIHSESLLKTLAAKYQKPVSHIYRKYKMYNAEGRKVIGVKIIRKDKKPLIASYGKKPIQQNRKVTIKDEKPQPSTNRTEILQRLLHDECELCGKAGKVIGHHIRKLADLRKVKEKPKWVQVMIALRRKTLFVCQECHNTIHSGKHDGIKLT